MAKRIKTAAFQQVPNTLRKACAEVGSTDLVPPTVKKKKGNPNYRNGRAMEYKVMKDLRKKGLEVVRTAGSHGVADIVAFHPRSLTDGLVDILPPKDLIDLVLEGWQRLHDDKVLGDFLYGGMQVAKGEQHEYTIHCSPVLSVLIQCKRRKR